RFIARRTRDLTVPSGMSSALAISLCGRSSKKERRMTSAWSAGSLSSAARMRTSRSTVSTLSLGIGSTTPSYSSASKFGSRSRRNRSMRRLRAMVKIQVEADARVASNDCALFQTVSMVSCARSSAAAGESPRRRKKLLSRGAKLPNSSANCCLSFDRAISTRHADQSVIARAPRPPKSCSRPRARDHWRKALNAAPGRVWFHSLPVIGAFYGGGRELDHQGPVMKHDNGRPVAPPLLIHFPLRSVEGPMKKIAIIGTGISGLSAAYLLSRSYDVTVYEKQARLGGHSRTVDVAYGDTNIAVDTGFIVFNERNYPNLTALFRHLDVPVKNSDMSFALTVGNGWLEWGAKDLAAILGQRRHLLRPKFLKLFADVMRFNKDAVAEVQRAPDVSVDGLIRRMGLGDWFRRHYLLPMAGAIWSCPPCQMLEFP